MPCPCVSYEFPYQVSYRFRTRNYGHIQAKFWIPGPVKCCWLEKTTTTKQKNNNKKTKTKKKKQQKKTKQQQQPQIFSKFNGPGVSFMW